MMTRRRSGEECSKVVSTSSEMSVRCPMYPNRKPFGLVLWVYHQVLVPRGPNRESPFYIILFLTLYYSMHNLSVPEQRDNKLPVIPVFISSS